MSMIDAMRQALEALEGSNAEWKALADSGDAGFWSADNSPAYSANLFAIAALRTAIADAERCEPVAWAVEALLDDGSKWVMQHPVRISKADADSDLAMYSKEFVLRVVPLYTNPPMLTDAAVERAALGIANAHQAQLGLPPVAHISHLEKPEYLFTVARAALAAAWEAK